MYGLFSSLLAAKIAFWTWAGAAAGAAALPSGSSVATEPGTTMWAAVAGSLYAAPPVGAEGDSARAAAGSTAIHTSIRANARSDFKIKTLLFRRPTGLADGLALKEPAPHANGVIRPN